MNTELFQNLPKYLQDFILLAGRTAKEKVFGILYEFLDELEPQKKLEALNALIKFSHCEWAIGEEEMPNIENVEEVDDWADCIAEYIANESKEFYLWYHSQKFTLSYLRKLTTHTDYLNLPDNEADDLAEYVHIKYHALMNGTKEMSEPDLLDELTRIITEVFFQPKSQHLVKRDIWQVNQIKIGNAIRSSILNTGSVPNISAIANETGFSRRTVYNHIGSLSENPHFREHINIFQATIPEMIGKLYQLFIKDGDTKAGRLLFEILGVTKQKATNQYIQVNNLTITAEDIQRLPVNKRMEFERYLLETFGSETKHLEIKE